MRNQANTQTATAKDSRKLTSISKCGKWKTLHNHAGLLQYLPSGVYFARQRVGNLAAILFLLLNLAGCASPSGAVKNDSPVLLGNLVSLDFVFVESTSSLGDLETEKHLLNDFIVSGLRETQFFTSVSGNKADVNSGGGIKVAADIKEINKVSDNARLWTGALAGQSRILLQVTVSDLNSGNQIEVFEAEGQSGKSAFAGTTDEAIQLAAEQIVAKVVKLHTQSSI